MKKTISFSNSLKIDKGHILIQYKSGIIKKLAKYEKLCDRAEGAMHVLFCENNSSGWSQREDINSSTKTKESLLRCSLAEFVGMEDTLSFYFDKDKMYHIYDSKDPVLHFVRELRNFEIHIKESTIRNEKRDYVLILGDANKNVTIDIDILDINFESLKLLKNMKSYDNHEIVKMKECFDNLQNKWGYQEVLICAYEKYCNELINYYGM